jgi:Asp-tRNA(Asn)/Glu-tRNA(Gln) amidotransferase A subunit family amidase
LLHRYWGAAFIPATDYIKSLKLQRLVQEDFARTLQEVDVLVTPTNPTRAPLIGSHTFPIGGVEHGGAAVGVNMGIRNTHITNVTGHPSISVPCGFSNGGLPIGLQLIGRPFEEALLYRVASLYERVSPSAGKLPPIVEQAAAQ